MIKCRCSIGKFPKSCKENSNVHLEETAVEVEDVGCTVLTKIIRKYFLNLITYSSYSIYQAILHYFTRIKLQSFHGPNIKRRRCRFNMSGRSMIRVRSPESYLEELADIFKVIRSQEDSVYTCPDYLSEEFQQKQRDEVSMNPNLYFPSGMSTSTASSCTGINEVWREKICEWCYQVVDHFDYNRQVVSIALNYLDRYLALRPVNRKIFQLAAMTCLFLAIKLNETRPLSLPAFLSLSRGYFQADHVLKMEHAILR